MCTQPAFRPTTSKHSTLLFNLPGRPRAPSATAASCRLRRYVAEEVGHGKQEDIKLRLPCSRILAVPKGKQSLAKIVSISPVFSVHVKNTYGMELDAISIVKLCC